MSLAVRSADVGGVRLEYAEQGDPRGIPVLLLHGYSDSRRAWGRVLAHLPGAVRAIALTQRGHGDSDKPESGYAPADMATDAAGLLGVLGIESAIVVGHSMGTVVAQHLAIDHPRRVAGMVLLGAFATTRDDAGLRELAEVARDFTDPVDPAFVREFQEGTIVRPIDAAFVDVIVAESAKMPARVWRAALDGMLADDRTADWDRIVAPTEIVWGDRDDWTGPHQRRLTQGIAGARHTTYAGDGHSPHWESPRRLADQVVSFARLVRAVRAAA